MVGLFISLLIYAFIYNLRHPQKSTPKRRGLHIHDYTIIATVPENKWTEHLFLRIGIDLVDEPHTYLYKALFINNDTYVYKLDDIWIEKETQQETEYSNFIGMAVDNYLLSKKTKSNTTGIESLDCIEIKLSDKNTNLETPSKNTLKTSEKGILLIKNFEGLRLKAYQCSSSVWTIGWGTTMINGIKVESGDIINEEMAEILFAQDIKLYEDIVNSNIKIPINQNQFDALVSHTYNTGGSENLFELINSKAGKKRIRNWFLNSYITSRGNLTQGLVRRRKIEADLFFHNTK